MRIITLVTLMLLLIMNVCCASDKTEIVKIISDNVRFCESVYPYEGGLLISNFGSDEPNPRADENKGYILDCYGDEIKYLIPADGRLHKPTAMAIKDNFLFVCDDNSLKIFDLKHLTAEPQILKFAADDLVVNDIVLNGNELYATITNSGRIYKLDVSDPSSMSKARVEKWLKVPGPNGIAISGKSMYIVTIPPDYVNVKAEHVVYKVEDINKPKLKKFIDVPVLYDGVAFSSDESILYISNWSTASVIAVNLKTKATKTIYEEKGIGPADIAARDGYIYVPDLPNSRVIVLSEH